jgi:hypothetical protein
MFPRSTIPFQQRDTNKDSHLARQHLALAVFIMLADLVLLGGLQAGHGMAKSKRPS